jgi:hypothetical protein
MTKAPLRFAYRLIDSKAKLLGANTPSPPICAEAWTNRPREAVHHHHSPKETAMGTKEKYGYGSRFLRAEDLAGKTATVTIATIEDVEFDRGVKPVLHFEGKKKALVTNATNFDTLAAAISPRTQDWVGHVITLKGEKVPFRGKLVDSIRVIVPVKQAAKEDTPDDLVDGIPDDFAA